ncbi:MAG: hypothetical protein J6D61_03660 [Clostridia bacterium]|nr:hypothetical protein [Clostridia bacterium]
MLKTGFAKRPITPQKSMTLAGFDRRSQPAQGMLDELYVTVLALQNGEEAPFLLCSFDLLGTDRTLCEKVRQALPLPPERVWVCATHTHGAPRGAFSGGISQDHAYIDSLVANCKAAAFAAMDDLLSAQALWGEATAEGVASLRDVPRTQAAYAMPLLSLRLKRENDTLHWLQFQCHPTVLDESNLCYSRDLPGGIAGENTIFTNGACADLSTRFTRMESSAKERERLGLLIKSAWNEMEYQEDIGFGERIRPIARELVLPYGNGVRGDQRLGLLEELRQKTADCTDKAALRELDACIAVLERGDRVLPQTRTVTVAACDLGSRLLLALPFEVAQADGAQLEREAAALCEKPAYLICYCGGYDGYLPHAQTGVNYQDLATGYLPEARKQIWQGVLDCAASAVK